MWFYPMTRNFHYLFVTLRVTYVALLLSLSPLTLSAAAADAGKRMPFDIAAADAPVALKQFAQQSKIELLYSTGEVAGTRTNQVRGELLPREALVRLLEGTGLIVTQGKNNGALAVTRVPDPNVQRAALTTNSDRPQNPRARAGARRARHAAQRPTGW